MIYKVILLYLVYYFTAFASFQVQLSPKIVLFQRFVHRFLELQIPLRFYWTSAFFDSFYLIKMARFNPGPGFHRENVCSQEYTFLFPRQAVRSPMSSPLWPLPAMPRLHLRPCSAHLYYLPICICTSHSTFLSQTNWHKPFRMETNVSKIITSSILSQGLHVHGFGGFFYYY